MTGVPQALRVEHLGDGALGIGTAAPRLSWQMPMGVGEQVAYEVEIDGNAFGRTESDRQVLVAWPGEEIGSATRVDWRVRVWTGTGESAWSEPAWFETGLLRASDWCAQWIEPPETELLPAGARPAHVLRTTFTLGDVPDTARLYATAHGIYECFLNGRRVGDLELTPGFTSYRTNLHVQVYDVTDLVRSGGNDWRVVLSDGWFRGKHGNWQRSEGYGDRVAFLGELHAGGAVVASGPEWSCAPGSILAADLMDGQVQDLNVVPEHWSPVANADHGVDQLTYSPAPPTRAVETVRPVAVRRLTADRQIVDLGQNINGRVRLRVLGPAGTATTLVHGEALDADGDVTLEHLSSAEVALRQQDLVVSAGQPGAVFEPRHTVHGFQYVRVVGLPERLVPDDVGGVVVRSDLRRTGWFRCSDERLNRLHEIADWSLRDNTCDIPTDCPTRERNGWTGDWQIFFPSAAFLYDVAGFSLKWLRDVAAEQLPNGCVLNIAPDPMRARDPDPASEPIWHYLQGSSGWGDAIVIVPWEMYRAYGDDGVLAECWPHMVRWLDYATDAARTKRFAGRAATRPDPAPHERYLWDGGHHFGEWLEPGGSGGNFWEQDQGHVGTAYLHHSASLAARIGRLIGHDADAERFEALAANALGAWRTEYLGGDGTLTPDTQAAHVRALAFGLVPDAVREQTASRLVDLIRDAGTHLGTGFLATPYLLPVLVDTGHEDVAYDVLLQTSPPSWLAMVERGATTVWEEWEGIGEDGSASASLNHYSKGAVIAFLHRYVAGIRLVDGVPAYRRVRIEPRPGGGVTWAEGVHDSPYGRIESSWRLHGDRFRLTVTVPAGTTAEVVLPDGARHVQPPGVATYECGDPADRR